MIQQIVKKKQRQGNALQYNAYLTVAAHHPK